METVRLLRAHYLEDLTEWEDRFLKDIQQQLVLHS